MASETVDVEINSIAEPTNNETRSLIWSDFNASISNFPTISSSTNSALSIMELRQYREEVLINRNTDPLRWWKTRELVYPRLAKLAKKQLGIVATSVPSEKSFSKAGLLVSDRRSRLKDNLVSQIIFLNANFKFSK